MRKECALFIMSLFLISSIFAIKIDYSPSPEVSYGKEENLVYVDFFIKFSTGEGGLENIEKIIINFNGPVYDKKKYLCFFDKEGIRTESCIGIALEKRNQTIFKAGYGGLWKKQYYRIFFNENAFLPGNYSLKISSIFNGQEVSTKETDYVIKLEGTNSSVLSFSPSEKYNLQVYQDLTEKKEYPKKDSSRILKNIPLLFKNSVSFLKWLLLSFIFCGLIILIVILFKQISSKNNKKQTIEIDTIAGKYYLNELKESI